MYHCVTLPIDSSVLSQLCVCPSCVAKCLRTPPTHDQLYKTKHVSFHRLTVGRWVTAQPSYHSCVRRKVKSMNRRPRLDVPPRMWVLLDSKWCAFICFFQEKLAVFRFLLLFANNGNVPWSLWNVFMQMTFWAYETTLHVTNCVWPVGV